MDCESHTCICMHGSHYQLLCYRTTDLHLDIYLFECMTHQWKQLLVHMNAHTHRPARYRRATSFQSLSSSLPISIPTLNCLNASFGHGYTLLYPKNPAPCQTRSEWLIEFCALRWLFWWTVSMGIGHVFEAELAHAVERYIDMPPHIMQSWRPFTLASYSMHVIIMMYVWAVLYSCCLCWGLYPHSSHDYPRRIHEQ